MQYKKRFFMLATPTIRQRDKQLSLNEAVISTPQEATLILDGLAPYQVLKQGIQVRTGEFLRKEGVNLFLSPFTGILNSISEIRGYFNKSLTSLNFELSQQDQIDETISDLISSGQKTELLKTLNYLPGVTPYPISEGENQLDTLIISLLDCDPLSPLNQFLLSSYVEEITEGANFVRGLARNAVLAVGKNSFQNIQLSDFEIRTFDDTYPNTIPSLVVKNITGKRILKRVQFLANKIGYIDLYHLIILGKILKQKSLNITVPVYVSGDGKSVIANVRIGTPIYHILNLLGIQSYNIIVSNNLLSGETVYDLHTPILPNIRSLITNYIILDKKKTENNCINCGECVRICPARVPINMLIRYLKNKQYEDAENLAELSSCLECGICSFVCPSKIPIFHYIMLGKYELSSINNREG